MKSLSSDQFRQLYQKFVESHGHIWLPSASLVPENDPSVLFTTAGMQPLVPNLLGQPHPSGKRLANIQRCLRTVDIDEVGDATHNTFFEMLGYWSLGDYFKMVAIAQTWQFFTADEWLGLDPQKMAVSVFAGDENASKDTESEAIWLKQPNFPGQGRISYLDKDENWWPAGGGTAGPCGPDTETFYWIGQGEAPAKFDPNDKNWVEVCNNVFIQFERLEDGAYQPLKHQSVDMGMGLARVIMILQDKNNVYDTDLFAPIIENIRANTKHQSVQNERVIADHLRAVVFLAMDGVIPSNKDQGYVMRRLLRRAIIKWQHGLKGSEKLSEKIVPVVIELYASAYPELQKKADEIIKIIEEEERKFERTLSAGLRQVSIYGQNLKGGRVTGKMMFDLFTSYGIPLELQPELFVHETGARFDPSEVEEFNRLFKEHQKGSKAGAEGKFKGGLADTSEAVVRLHTATHLLHEALRRVLGEHVEQRGSNITAERLRFDFVHSGKMTDAEIKSVEDLANDVVKQDLPVAREVLSKTEADKLGARAIFGEKYGDLVSVYAIGPDNAGHYFSREFCGGPHVTHTGAVGKIKIIKEEAVSAGVRRIKAAVE